MKNGYPMQWGVAFCILLAGCGAGTESDADTQQAGAIEQADVSLDKPEAETTADPNIDENAVALLKEMTSKVAGLQEFMVTLETGFDVLQPTGQKLEFGSRRTATIRRPDRARFTYEERSGVTGELVFDGTDIYAYEREQNVYATIEQPGDIDTSIDLVTMELGIPVPVSDFFAADPGVALAAGVLEARDMGSSTINNQPGRQIALRKPGVDYQIWISDATKLPMRTVITYYEEPGQPQFWAQFLSWETTLVNSDAAFEFSPPEGSERIRFGVFDTPEDAGEEAP